VTDGLPAVPPTAARVAAAVAASGRSRDELVAELPTRFGRATVEKVAVNAVMAGCRPEYLVLAADVWSKARAWQFLWERLRKPVRELRPGRDGGEGLSDEALAVFPEGARSDALVPKFQAPESLKLLVAGGPAGRFTAIVPGWPFRNAPSRLILRKIART